MAVATQRFLSSRARWLVFALLIVVAVYLLAVTPARTYFQQRQEMAEAQQRYDTLKSANEELTQRARDLQTDEAIGQLARDQYELVPPGADAYAVMPPAAAQSDSVAADGESDGWFSETTDKLTFWN